MLYSSEYVLESNGFEFSCDINVDMRITCPRYSTYGTILHVWARILHVSYVHLITHHCTQSNEL